jgi:hypothetical protein
VRIVYRGQEYQAIIADPTTEEGVLRIKSFILHCSDREISVMFGDYILKLDKKIVIVKDSDFRALCTPIFESSHEVREFIRWVEVRKAQDCAKSYLLYLISAGCENTKLAKIIRQRYKLA